jgi:hypothetical protein
MAESFQQERASYPSAGLGPSLAGGNAGFSDEDRRFLSRILVRGVSRMEFSAIALCKFCNVTPSVAAAFLKITPAQLQSLLQSFERRLAEIRSKEARDLALARCDAQIVSVRLRKIVCSECGYKNQWRPGDGPYCTECALPLDDKMCRKELADRPALCRQQARKFARQISKGNTI